MIFSFPTMIDILKGEEMIHRYSQRCYFGNVGTGKDVCGKPLVSVLPEPVGQGLMIYFIRFIRVTPEKPD
jgi:hypothetical protein